MNKLKQNQLNSLEMSKIIGARTKSTIQGSNNTGACIEITYIDRNDGVIRKVKVKPCSVTESLESELDSDF